MIYFIAILSACLAYYLCFILYQTVKFISYNPTSFKQNLSVTVIIPARNEEKNIVKCLDSLKKQVYDLDKLQIIVVNDFSDDNTLGLSKLNLVDSKINYLVLDKSSFNLNASKKECINLALSKSSGDIILCTDADCVMGPFWVQTMVSFFSKQTQLVSGPVKMSHLNTFEGFQALESIGLITIGAAYIASKQPTLANGANLAYRKSAFEAVNGFVGIDQIASGDDELLMHKINEKYPDSIVFAKDSNAIVTTNPCTTFNELYNQRLRWVTKSTIYKEKRITITLMISYLASLFFPVAFIYSFFNPDLLPLPLIGLLCKIFAEGTILFVGNRFLNNGFLLKYLVFEQFFHILYVVWIGVAANLVKKYEWKGRKVH